MPQYCSGAAVKESPRAGNTNQMSAIFNYESNLSETMNTRFEQFMGALNDPTKEVVRVFDPLPKKLLEELELIREVTAQLQRKKQEDMEKASAPTNAAEEMEKKSSEENNPKDKSN